MKSRFQFLVPFLLLTTISSTNATEVIDESAGFSVGQDTLVVIPKPRYQYNERYEYVVAQLTAALKATESDYGDWRIQYTTWQKELSQPRQASMVQNKTSDLNLIWMMTDTQKESNLHPIKIPLLKGLQGHRLCLVLNNKLPLFQDIHSLRDVQKQKISFGQGHSWPDSTIINANELSLTTSGTHDSLLQMLRKERFDCFTRGANEILFELKDNPDLVLEPNLLFVYPAPSYFFVARSNIHLQNRLNQGLQNTLESGLFNDIFHQYFGEMIEKLQLHERTQIKLDNPMFTDSELLDRKDYWIDLSPKD